MKEALKEGIDRSDEYKYKTKEYEISVIFGAFIKKVIYPDIKIDQKELKAHYQENHEKYTFPEMMRIKELVFGKKSDALSAMEKLGKGTDFNWLSSSAEGQVDRNSKNKGLLTFEGANTVYDNISKKTASRQKFTGGCAESLVRSPSWRLQAL